jgi:hypothetical protein
MPLEPAEVPARVPAETTVRRGYRLVDFDDAFSRYLPLLPEDATSATPATGPDANEQQKL